MEQKKFDYNSFIGMILLAGIFLYWMNTTKPDTEPEKITTEQVTDSIKTTTNQNTLPKEAPVVFNDSLQQVAAKNKLGAFAYTTIAGKQETKILENERVQIVNVNNGERIETYVIKGERGSGVICLNGPAARRVEPGDLVIIISYGYMTMDEIKSHNPVVVYPSQPNNQLK